MRALNQGSHRASLLALFVSGTLLWGCAMSDKLAARFLEDFQELKRTLKNPEDSSWEDLKAGTITCVPETVPVGGEIKMESAYSVRPSGWAESITVREVWNLKQRGKVLHTLKDEEKIREKGTFQVRGRLVLPPNILPGPYSIEHRIETCPSPEKTSCVYVAQECSFQVAR